MSSSIISHMFLMAWETGRGFDIPERQGCGAPRFSDAPAASTIPRMPRNWIDPATRRGSTLAGLSAHGSGSAAQALDCHFPAQRLSAFETAALWPPTMRV